MGSRYAYTRTVLGGQGFLTFCCSQEEVLFTWVGDMLGAC